jgi:transcriptional regulator with XRE-family HTH domain
MRPDPKAQSTGVFVLAKRSPTLIDKQIGARLRVRRVMLRMSQQRLASRLGISFQQVQKYEKGTNRIGAARLQHICQILQVPVGFFFKEFPASEAKAKRSLPSDVLDFLATADGLALTTAFMRIRDKRLRRCILDLVEGSAAQVL